jgi:uncharacterized protein DUF1629
VNAVRVYEFEVQEGYEWVVPVAPADFEVFRAFDGSAKRTGWAPIRVRLVEEDEQGRPLLPSDVPWLGKHAPVLKVNASEALRPVLTRDGELLPLMCEESKLVVYNVTRVLDALDLDRSEVVKFPSTGRIMKVKSYVFRPDRVRGHRAFKVPELLRGSVFVTDEVVSTAKAAGLTGVGFRMVWEGSVATA